MPSAYGSENVGQRPGAETGGRNWGQKLGAETGGKH